MPRYISLLNWTERGITNFQDTIDRAEAGRKVAADMGGSLEVHWTIGQYDMVAISEFADDETATAFMLKIGSLGNVRTHTMRSFDTAEMERIIGTATG